MGLDFDLKTFCQNLKATKPPYECPIHGCGKVYKSFNGIQCHLYNYDHDNPDTSTPGKTPNNRKSGRGRWPRQIGQTPTGVSPLPSPLPRSPARETLTYAEAQRMVEIDVDGNIHRLNIYEPLDIILQEEIDNCDNTEKEEKPKMLEPTPITPSSVNKVQKTKDKGKSKEVMAAKQPPPIVQKLPEAIFKELDDYIKPPEAPPRPTSYYRFIEKTSEELDEDIEYDMDEEDFAWLELVNEKRDKGKLPTVSQELFEELLDRFEKEAFFQSQTSGKDLTPSIDEDAVCSICMDGECQNSNVILFCDMCNLAVHQECYGVPYIPEGQWLCRRCLQSPSKPVDCCLCPNKGGAFKQTDDNRWAHVVCALWIPEVGFANTVFLEPIDSFKNIPAARWRLSCYICKQRSCGACIQCHKTNCYTAFHVTCAQQAGLYMKIEPVRDMSINGLTVTVRKTAFCDVHMPPDATFQPMIDNGVDIDDERRVMSPEEAKAKSRLKMRKARKLLAERRNATPTVSIPVIPQQRLSKIAESVNVEQKSEFLSLLHSYWTLKRQSRNGVPLLRRLQSNHMARSQGKDDKESNALKAQLKYWQRLRQDLEKARLLVELIRKREKLKREELRLRQMALELQLQPYNTFLRHTLEALQEKDTGNIFAEPVSHDEVPDYLDHISVPMDFSTMSQKIDGHCYADVDDFECDFNLMINNCLAYNSKDTVFYRTAIRLRDQGGAVIRNARRSIENIGYDQKAGLHTPEKPDPPKDPVILEDVDSFLSPEMRENMALEDQLRLLLDKLDLANAARPNRKSRLAKQIKKEIARVRRQLALQKGQEDDLFSDQDDLKSPGDTASDSAGSDDDGPGSSSRSRCPTPVNGSEVTEESVVRRRGRPTGSLRRASTSADQEEDSTNKRNRETKDNSQTPTGVSRRSSILFGKKARTRSRRDSDDVASQDEQPTSARRHHGRQPKSKLPAPSTDSEASRTDSTAAASNASTEKKTESQDSTKTSANPTPASRKRTASMAGITLTSPSADSMETSQSLPKRTLLHSADIITTIGDGPSLFSSSSKKDSFLKYRNFPQSRSDADSSTDNGNSDSSGSDTDSSSRDSSSDSEAGGSPKRYSRRVRKRKHSGDGFLEEEDEDTVPLEPLDLVWAKCRGYPWYPALIINPKMPKTGYFHNGVPIPVPPEEVLLLQQKHEVLVYLVLFFDTKRTWQWLPRTKLEPLGVDSGLDKAKLLENKKPNVRKAVRKAYEKAILHRCKVTGEPNPLSSAESDLDD